MTENEVIAARKLYERLMLVHLADNRFVRSQLKRAGIALPVKRKDLMKRRDLENEIGSCSALGSRVLPSILEAAWAADSDAIYRAEILTAAGRTFSEALDDVARWTVRQELDRANQHTPVRQAVNRGIRDAKNVGSIEELVALWTDAPADLDLRLKSAQEQRWIGEVLRVERRKTDEALVLASWSPMRHGRNFGLKRVSGRFLGTPSQIQELMENNQFERYSGPSRENVLDSAARVRKIVLRSRYGRGTKSRIQAIPGAEVVRVIRELAETLRAAVPRAWFMAGIFRTLRDLDTIFAENDPNNPFDVRVTDAHGRKVMPRE